MVEHADDREVRLHGGVIHLGLDDVAGALVSGASEEQSVERDFMNVSMASVVRRAVSSRPEAA
ncbi:hypothetical protein [Microbacterium paraoxydans]|uniref:hypothetical protein n=1 Tax=Microbacterium paraoxydans TaxID=199592 RepID=UPI003D756EB9